MFWNQKIHVHEHQDETHNDSGVEPTEDHREWVHLSPCGRSFIAATQNETDWDQLSEYFVAFAVWSHSERDHLSPLGVELSDGHSKWDRLSTSLATPKYGHSKWVHLAPLRPTETKWVPKWPIESLFDSIVLWSGMTDKLCLRLFWAKRIYVYFIELVMPHVNLVKTNLDIP